MNMDGFVKLTSFSESSFAGLAKSALEAEGIHCYLTNENISTLHYPPNVSAIELFVAEQEADRAVQVLTDNPDVRFSSQPKPLEMKTNIWNGLFLPIIKYAVVAALVYFIFSISSRN